MSVGRVKLERSRWNHVAALLAATAAAACGTDDVVVATVPAPVEVDGGAGCATNDDCEPIEFCARQSCSDAHGTCDLRPVLCDDAGAPSCGCDGVSYWNDCLRMQYGATASQPGSCATGAATCLADNALDCPVLGAACAKLFPPGVACDDTQRGACWVLPVACPQFGPPDQWASCDSRMECRGTCDAIRTGRPYHHDIMRQCSPDGPRP
jgi:hypothetical protein